MSYSYTSASTTSFTKTSAKHLASLVSADLRQLQRHYGSPSDETIANLAEEVVTLLTGGYLKSVKYGFQRNGKWVVCLEYRVVAGVLEGAGDRPGRVYSAADTRGAYWASFLNRTQSWWDLKEEQRDKISAMIPVKRTSGTEPGTVAGAWMIDKTYSRDGTSLTRRTFQPNE